MSKLAPPGVSVLPINMRYPTEAGPVHSHSTIAVHQGGRQAHLAHGGQYNILMGYSHLQAHMDLLAQEVTNTLVYWEQHKNRIIVNALTEDQRKAELIEKVKQSKVFSKIEALRQLSTPLIRDIQEDLKAQGEALMAKEVAENEPKNGYHHDLANEAETSA